MKVAAIIQARMGSTRLPGKMMMKILGKPIIRHVIERVEQAPLVNDIWLATTVNKEDDVLAKWAEDNKVKYYRGSVDDVLDRYYQVTLLAQADAVIRITGDCPLIDPEIIDKVVGEYLKGGYDYICNRQPPTWPDGLDTEVFSMATLKKDWEEAVLKSDREHVTTYVWQHPRVFKLRSLAHVPDLSSQRWTLDTPEDLRFLRLIFEELQKRHQFGHLAEVLAILQEHPDWLKINAQYRRNEGYQKSLKEDQL